jgi:hypothetical protein
MQRRNDDLDMIASSLPNNDSIVAMTILAYAYSNLSEQVYADAIQDVQLIIML